MNRGVDTAGRNIQGFGFVILPAYGKPGPAPGTDDPAGSRDVATLCVTDPRSGMNRSSRRIILSGRWNDDPATGGINGFNRSDHSAIRTMDGDPCKVDAAVQKIEGIRWNNDAAVQKIEGIR